MHKIYFAIGNATEQEMHIVLMKLVRGYTLYSAHGYWEGIAEPSYALELMGETDQSAETIAEGIKYAFHQESVLIVHIPVTVTFI